jgi:hypothetical protein
LGTGLPIKFVELHQVMVHLLTVKAIGLYMLALVLDLAIKMVLHHHAVVVLIGGRKVSPFLQIQTQKFARTKIQHGQTTYKIH